MTVPFRRRLAIALGAVGWFVLLICGALGGVVLAIAPLWLTAVVVVAAALFALPLLLLRKLVTPADIGWSPTLAFVKAFVFFLAFESAAVGLPVYYLAYLVDARPTLMPLVTLTDGRKTVQLQGMQHVGSETFYKGVVYDLREAASQGYRLYYEGVQPVPDRPDLKTWFDGLTTGNQGDLSDRYKALADGCGMQFQLDYFQGLAKDMAVHPETHVTADVDYADLKAEYDRLMREDPAFAASESAAAKPPASGDKDAFALFLAAWKAGTPDQKRLLGLACRGFFAWAFSNKTTPSERDKLIIDFRNARLAKRIADSPDEKIYVTYGARHIPGVIEDLKALNPGWRVVSVKWAPAIANPQTRKGELS